MLSLKMVAELGLLKFRGGSCWDGRGGESWRNADDAVDGVVVEELSSLVNWREGGVSRTKLELDWR